jgi:hypothetical protein
MTQLGSHQVDGVPGGGFERGRRRRRLGLAVGLATLLSAGAGVAQARTAVPVECTERTTTKALAAWGDMNEYFPLPGGRFESAEGWFRTALVAPEPGMVEVNRSRPLLAMQLRRSDAPAVDVPDYAASAALAVPESFRTTSAPVCFKPDEPSVRLFYKDPGVAGTSLVVEVFQISHEDALAGGVVGAQRRSLVRLDPVVGPPQWRLSPVILTQADHTGDLARGEYADLLVTFTVVTTDRTVTALGEWLVDNVYVDPFRSR